jgi:hypothetical protein
LYLGSARLGVRDLGLLLAVVGSDLRLEVPSFVYSVGYSAHTSKQAIIISTHIIGRARGGEINGEGKYISPRGVGVWFGGGITGKGVVKFWK